MRSDHSADIVIVGSGASGAAVAREAAGRGRKVLLLERSRPFDRLGTVKGALRYYDRCALSRSVEGYIIYRNLMAGGTTVCSCGNAVRSLENHFERLGIDLSAEFSEAEADLGVAPARHDRIGKGAGLVLEKARSLGYTANPMMKAIDMDRCVSCGSCTQGCAYGAKWTALRYLDEARGKGTDVMYGAEVDRVTFSGGKVNGLIARVKRREVQVKAGSVVLCAGGIGTPVILQRSGVTCGDHLFVDLFNVTYGVIRGYGMRDELSMSVLICPGKDEKGFILSPFMDNPLSLLSCTRPGDLPRLRHYGNLVGIMTKIDDDPTGRVCADGRVYKAPSKNDARKLYDGSSAARRILVECGASPGSIFVTNPRGAHPGGTARLGEVVDERHETGVKGLYVCDSSALPFPPGAPPILLLVALAKRFSRKVLFAGSDMEGVRI